MPLRSCRISVTIQKGTDNGQECLFMLAMAEYQLKDYEAASETFKKYYQTYPQGVYAETASFYIGQSLYQCTPEARLDQTPTVAAIAAFQNYLDLFPNGKLKSTAEQRMFELQDKFDPQGLSVRQTLLQSRILFRQLHQRRQQLRGMHRHGRECTQRLPLLRHAREVCHSRDEKQVRVGQHEY